MSHNDIDNLFYDAIEGHREYPSGKVWNKLEADLDKKAANLYKKKYEAVRRYAFFLSAALILTIILAVVNTDRDKQLLTDKSSTGKYLPSEVYSDNEEQKQSQGAVTGPLQDNTVFEEPVLNNGLSLFSGENKNDRPEGLHPKRETLGDLFSIINPIEISVEPPVAESTDNIYPQPEAAEEETVNTASMHFGDAGNIIYPGKKDFTGNLQYIYPPESPMNFINSIVRNNIHKANNQDRFSLTLYASPAFAWTTIEDVRQGSRRNSNGAGGSYNGTRGNNNGGNNNNGNSNGGNGGTNNSSGNNGGGNGNGNVGNTGNNGNSNNNNGGGRGRLHEDGDYYNKNEQEAMAYYGGVALDYKLSKRFSIGTGLTFLSSSTITDSKKIYAVTDNNGDIRYQINSSSGYTYIDPTDFAVTSGSQNQFVQTPVVSAGDSIVIKKTKTTLTYVGIPATASYKILSKGRFSLTATGGAQANVLVSGKTKAHFNGSHTTTTRTEGVRTAYFSLLGSITGEVTVSKNLSVTISPAGQFGISSISKSSSISTRPNYAGISAGVRLKL